MCVLGYPFVIFVIFFLSCQSSSTVCWNTYSRKCTRYQWCKRQIQDVHVYVRCSVSYWKNTIGTSGLYFISYRVKTHFNIRDVYYQHVLIIMWTINDGMLLQRFCRQMGSRNITQISKWKIVYIDWFVVV